MSYRSEIKKVMTKHYPKYRVIKVLAPHEGRIFTFGNNETIDLDICIEAKRKPKK
jgi:hypothetical protein